MLQFEGFGLSWIKSRILTISVVILALIIATPFLLPSGVYKGFFKNYLQNNTGLTFEFRGAFTFTLFPALSLKAEDVAFHGPLVGSVETVGSFKTLSLDMSSISLLTGNIEVDDFLLYNPKVTINGDFLPHLPEFIRQNLRGSKKEDIRYLEILLHFIEDSVFESAKVSEGTLQWNRKEGQVISAQQVEMLLKKPSGGKDFTIDSHMYLNNRGVDLNVRLQSPDEFLRGYRSSLTAQLDSAPLKINFDGSAAQRHSFVSQGDVRFDIPSTYDLCTWFNQPKSCLEKNDNVLINSKLSVRDQKLQIEEAVFTKNPTTAILSGAIDFKSALPMITGTINVPKQTLKELLPSADDFYEFDFNNLFLNSYNANVGIKFQGIDLQNAVSLTPRLKVEVEDARLTLSTTQMNAFKGLTNLRLRWNKGVDEGVMNFRMDSKGISLEEVQKAFGMPVETLGTLNYFYEAQAWGTTPRHFLETSKIHGEFSILDGLFKNTNVAQSLNAKQMPVFEFAELKGHLKGEKGQVNSDDIKVVAPFVQVEGIAGLNFNDQTFKLLLNSTIPATANAPQSKGYVNIEGPWQDLTLDTTMEATQPKQRQEGLHSGFLPNTTDDIPTDETATTEDDDFGDMVIEEADLLD
ncbi:AsmA family protein [Terasakiella pusilla]|uniref:AsmA family protein n=1 Tax=Terasakiella pusilla TaxID=64973 RepID=UPI00048E7AF0|nr:AsmA-like C-terminal region-containing protein [Terasakiella pusilla]